MTQAGKSMRGEFSNKKAVHYRAMFYFSYVRNAGPLERQPVSLWLMRTLRRDEEQWTIQKQNELALSHIWFENLQFRAGAFIADIEQSWFNMKTNLQDVLSRFFSSLRHILRC